tara:strand:+ start:842 stop:1051 length:210 start_codon:yes stop_codon:yes gene_type:complete
MDLPSLLFSALAAEFGLRIQTNNPELLRQKLYSARKTDETFSALTFLPAPNNPTAELWIIKKGQKNVQG